MSSKLISQNISDFLFVQENPHSSLQTEKTKKKALLHQLISSNNIISFLKTKYPNNFKTQKNIIKNIAMTYFENVNIPVLLEFYRMEGDFLELQKIIRQLETSNNSEHHAWAHLYSLMLQYSNNTIGAQELINASMEVSTTTKEMKVYSLIVHLFGIFQLNLYDSFYKLNKHIMPLVDEIENDYLRNSYRLQLMQIHAASNLSLNEVSTSREICQEALNQNLEVFFPSLYSNFYHIMATSYLFTSFEDTIHWLNKASNCLFSLSPNHIQFQTSEIQQTLYFAENFWRRNLNYLPTDPSEAAHRLIVMNKKEEAKKILINTYKQQGYFSPFQEYYYGIVSFDFKHLQDSKEKFEWESNYFYLQLFQQETLHRYGFN